MTDVRTVSVWSLLLITIAVIAWDAYVYFALHRTDATYSRILFDWSRQPWGFLLVLAAGVLMGHWFVDAKRWDLLVTLLAGIAGGAMYWGQKPRRKTDRDQKDIDT